MAAIRVSNLKLAIGLCGLAFLLSTPLIDFGAWSTRSQLARLESGRVSAKEFDFAALRFDFGPPGKAAVERLAKSGKTPDIREGATLALKAENRWAATTVQEERDAAADLDDRLTIKPATVPLHGNLRTALVGYDACGQDNKCAIVYHPGDTVVHGARLNCDDCRATVFRLRLIGGKWQSANRYANVAEELQQDDSAADKAALDKGQIEVRDVTSKQVFLGGRPVGDPFAVGAAPER